MLKIPLIVVSLWLGFACQAEAATLRYLLEGNYNSDESTSENVRGGSFRVSADFDSAQPPDSSSPTVAQYSNSTTRVQTFGTVNDLDLVFPAPAFLLLFEKDPDNDSLSVQMLVPGDVAGTGEVGFQPIVVVAAFGMEFFDEAIVSGAPLGLPIFDDGNSAISFPVLQQLSNVDAASVTFRVEFVPEPAGLVGCLWGIVAVAGCLGWQSRAGRRMRR